MSTIHALPGRAPSASGLTSSPVPTRDRGATERHSGLEAGVLADPPASAIFTMPTPPSANNLFRNVKGVGRVKAGIYDDFVRRGVAAIRRQKVDPVPGHVIAIFGVERMSDQADIDNRLKAMLDTIVTAEVIEDDRFVTAIAISWLPKANGMAHVRLVPVRSLSLDFHPSNKGSTGGWFIPEPQPHEEEPF